ncbi:MAG: ATP-binding protein [Bacteroidetes bacterium]|nr:ATP-binding protein [Bacteroidota bacterium]
MANRASAVPTKKGNPAQDSREGGVKDRLRFRISTGLKRVLGSELITDDEVALFELVKNSFDARARNVYLHFSEDEITVVDDGEGMSLDDLQNKWLFVAFSSKRNHNKTNKSSNYRDQVEARNHYAGSKGVGRFSSDRLGKTLQLQSRSKTESKGVVHRLDINWSDFDKDDNRQFNQVKIIHATSTKFDLPTEVPNLKHGTVIKISSLNKQWDRESLRKLRAGLAKLINPFGSEADLFKVFLIAPVEEGRDQEILSSVDYDQSIHAHKLINGQVQNFIFSALKGKTTYIEVAITQMGEKIETRLIDRGELIYRIEEPNEYKLLAGHDFKCQLFFLNRKAKHTFALRMGLPSVRFGSVFLFRNGFRVFPIGEEGDDWFGVDRRKQQGVRRFLGSRDIIGRIDVSGNNQDLQEASSRNQGLIESPAVSELRKCFREQCLKRLERYVVPVSWHKDMKADKDAETLEVVETDGGRALVTAAIADLVGNDDVQLLEYSTRLAGLLNERSEQFESSLSGLRLIADRIKDNELASRLDEAERRFSELKQSEANARRTADEERQAKLDAQSRAAKAEGLAQAAQDELGEERKRNLFLTSISTLDTDTILNMHHQITIYAADLNQHIENLLYKLTKKSPPTTEHLLNALESISLLNKKVLSIAKFATKANFRLDSERIEGDLSGYIVSYINDIAKDFVGSSITIATNSDNKPYICKFKPIDVSIVVDNLISNARRARASTIKFDLKHPRKETLEVRVSDDGKGIPAIAISDGKLFEKGFTTTNGSGLGLYHVRQVLSAMNGHIEVESEPGKGASFLLRIFS